MERVTVTPTDEMIIRDSKEKCIRQGINPELPPVFVKRYTKGELKAQLNKYSEVIEVIDFFVNKFLSSVTGNPILIAISNDEGYLLAFKGDPTIIDIVRQVGIKEGVQLSDEVGTNAISLCLSHQRPFQLVGEDHYHQILHHLVCCTAPFYKDEGRQLLGSLSFMTDLEVAHPHLLPLLCTIADSIERELLLRQGNAQLRLLNQILLETNYLGVMITDELGTIVNINENSVKMLRLERELARPLLGSSVFKLKDIGSYFERVIMLQEECTGREIVLERQGSVEYFMLDVVPVYDVRGSLSRVIGSLRNITEMKRTEEVLRNTEKLVFSGQLAMSIAHEIRNPLTTVKGMLQLSHKNSQLQHYDLIMSEVERMNLIVGEFLILGKPQAVKCKAERCGAILQEVVSIFEFQARMNNITINREIRQDYEIECDRNQIKQVFLNLLRNAMEALPFGGEIEIMLEVQEGFQVVSFTDNGEGMSPEVLQKIGEPFHTTRFNGNGLGMMIVKRIVSSHRGQVGITSKLGEGTVVEIRLPLA
ncbi:PAS domain S-box protein [Paenibacillus albidus]|uniref:ATP-binding protein n=1 Tax=Paenibacillus albidus TaxID=2041023 RepID=UPI001BE5A5A6|nr:ATP-binding protein [Paenibacillus albidus]MBT2289908.1 PAS domain S-box protein [Paenibacillus albidus]